MLQKNHCSRPRQSGHPDSETARSHVPECATCHESFRIPLSTSRPPRRRDTRTRHRQRHDRMTQLDNATQGATPEHDMRRRDTTQHKDARRHPAATVDTLDTCRKSEGPKVATNGATRNTPTCPIPLALLQIHEQKLMQVPRDSHITNALLHSLEFSNVQD